MIFRRKNAAKGLLAVAILAIVVSLLLGVQYFGMGANNVDFVKQKLEHIDLSGLWYVMLYMHIAGGMAALLLGWLQFRARFRRRNVAVHRLIGKIYTTGVALAALTGLYLAFYAEGGAVSAAGFASLSLAWMYSLYRGVKAIAVDGNRKAHGEWMLRSYALTFAAVMLRLYVPTAMAIFGEDQFDAYYRVIAWLCWVPNLLVAQLLIAGRNRRARFGPARAGSRKLL